MNYYYNRELSWLKFNTRVLEQAAADSVPFFEKLKFVSIFTSNLDEFFMIRVGSMQDRVLIDDDVPDDKTKLTVREQLDAMYQAVRPLCKLHDEYFREVTRTLSENGIEHLDINNLTAERKKVLKQYFKREILPLLSPQIIDTKHPFPHLENKRLYVLLSLKNKGKSKSYYGIIPIPGNLQRLLFFDPDTPNGILSYILIEDILLKYSSTIFKQYTVNSRAVIKITRNADVEVEDNFSDENIDYRDYVKVIIKHREKLAPVRMEVYSGSYAAHHKTVKYFRELAGLSEAQCYISEAPLDLSYVYSLENELKSKLPKKNNFLYSPFTPKYPKNITASTSMISTAYERDILLSYPYHSMKPYLKLLEETVNDPDTVSIKITLYRLCSNSKIIRLLCDAAENGHDVTVLVELKARFDETNNINWSKQLEEAGCNVIYGIDSLKVHSKITLITQKINDKIRYITHIATGNYNEKTALLYTDLGIITSDNKICLDAVNFFHNMTLGIPEQDDYSTLLVAPVNLKSKIINEIALETKKALNCEPAYIFMKMNGLTDKDIIDSLAEASEAGVKIDLIIRGVCCLLPGIKDATDNIRVRSIVGRFLEHSRIAVFGAETADRKIFIGSADLMTRNTTRRVEIWMPVLDKTIGNELIKMTEIMLRDSVKSSMMTAEGEYEKVTACDMPLDSQLYFLENA